MAFGRGSGQTLLQSIACGPTVDLQQMTLALQANPSSVTFETLGIERMEAFCGSGDAMDSDSSDSASSGPDEMTNRRLSTPYGAAMAAAEAAFSHACPSLVPVASSGIRAAARASGATATHFGPHPAVSSTDDLGGGRTAVVGRDALTDEQGAGRSDGGAAQDVTPCPTPKTGSQAAPSAFTDHADPSTPSIEQEHQPIGAQHGGRGRRRRRRGRGGGGSSTGGRTRRTRAHLTMRHRLMTIHMVTAGLTYSRVRRELPIKVSYNAVRNTWYRRAIHLSVLQLGNVDLDAVRYRPPTYPQLDAALLRWFFAVLACGKRVAIGRG